MKSGDKNIKANYTIPIAIIAAVTVVLVFWGAAFVGYKYLSFQAEVMKEVVGLEKHRSEVEKRRAELSKQSITLDRFTYCMQIMVAESHRAGRALSSKEAKEICKELQQKE